VAGSLASTLAVRPASASMDARSPSRGRGAGNRITSSPAAVLVRRILEPWAYTDGPGGGRPRDTRRVRARSPMYVYVLCDGSRMEAWRRTRVGSSRYSGSITRLAAAVVSGMITDTFGAADGSPMKDTAAGAEPMALCPQNTPTMAASYTSLRSLKGNSR
jgi:hypothetical protein